MPTLKDIQEQEMRQFLEDCECTGYRCPHEISGKHYIMIPEDIEHITTLAFQAGEKSKEDMVLKEIEKEKNIYHCFCNNGSCISHGYNLALSSLKEKIISNSK
jgi:hypothetical protein